MAKNDVLSLASPQASGYDARLTDAGRAACVRVACRGRDTLSIFNLHGPGGQRNAATRGSGLLATVTGHTAKSALRIESLDPVMHVASACKRHDPSSPSSG
jgi:hypothetical protein